MKRNIVAGLDLGTTKVAAIIAEIKDNDLIDVLGFGVAPSEGLIRGQVTNLPKTAHAVKEAMEIAINRAGIQVTSVNVGVAGEHITSMRHKNYVTINNTDREYLVKKGDKVVQIAILPVYHAEMTFIDVKDSEKTDRGEFGFGSSGK